MRRARRKKRATVRALYDEYRSEVVHNAPMPTLEEVREVVRAARKQERGLRRNSTNYVVTKGEEARQLAYFDSADWRTVCACAGIDVSAEQTKRAVLAMAGVQDGSKASAVHVGPEDQQRPSAGRKMGVQ